MRNSDRGYRRYMRHKKFEQRRRFLSEIGRYYYKPSIGWLSEDGSYIKRPKNSNQERYWKRYSNRVARRKKGDKEFFGRKGNKYKRVLDYVWKVY